MRRCKKLAVFLVAALLLSLVYTPAGVTETKAATKNNITQVGIKALPANNTIEVGDHFNFDPVILNTEEGKGKATTGLVYFEVKAATNTAGVQSARYGNMYPVYAGQFEIRAVAFANKTNLNAWLKARKANGYVEDANAGERYVTAYSDWTTIKVTSEEEGLAVARWQKQLDLALKNKKVTNILFTTDAEKTFTLKEGRYLYKTITIDAPNADIVNEARFQQINVEQIKGSTFFEKAVGNRFHITAPNASFHVAKGAEVSKLVFQPKNITNNAPKLNIVGAGGGIKNVSIASKGDVKISGETVDPVPVTVEETAEGATIDTQVKLELNVNASVSLSVGAQAAETVVNILKSVIATLTGAANNVQVNVDKAAEGATIQSETKVTVNTNANIKVELAAGAEGTEVKTGEGVQVEVKNDTTTNVTITDNNGNTSNVGQGEESTTTPAPTPTTPPSSGGSTGGSTPTPSATPTSAPETTLTVAVDKVAVEVEVGKTDTVTATVEDASENATYEWTASPAENVTLTNADTATVTVEGKVAGEVTLTVKVTDGEKTGTATVTVTVKESTGEEPSTTVKVEVKSASGTALTSVNIPTGSSVALTVEITSNDGALDLTDPTIEWTATEGVTVTPTTGESVTVKAEQDGTITVTVTLKNGIKIVNTITVKVQ